jgi:hypothetical protein
MRARVRIHHRRQVRAPSNAVQVHLEGCRRERDGARVHYSMRERQTERWQFAYARTAINTNPPYGCSRGN